MRMASKASQDRVDLSDLQTQWKEMFQQHLPKAATSHAPEQARWPVHVDHCFARIILDEVVGGGREPWIGKVKSPAYKNMSRAQLEEAIAIGESILSGDVDLVEMDEKSLRSRGKMGKGKGQDRGKKLLAGEQDSVEKSKYFPSSNTNDTKREHDHNDDGELSAPATKKAKTTGPTSSSHEPESPDHSTSPPSASKSRTPAHTTKESPAQPSPSPSSSSSTGSPAISTFLAKISQSSKTPFQKQVLSLLLQIPRGQYSTYGAISHFLKSSPRAVGNALRNNPFAPEVPCHRILATGGGLGGFGGSWGGKGKFKGREGENDAEKLRLLRAEGVRFDGKGKVVGRAWDGFT